MANTLRFKRGLASGIPTALAGEPLFTTDTFDLYIGNGTTNTRFQKYIASGTTSQLLRGDGSLLTMPIVLTSPANGQVLKFNGTSWVNDSDSGITGSGAAGQVAYFTGATTQAGNNNLFWDNTNGRLGVGTNTPNYTLSISQNNLTTLGLIDPNEATNQKNWAFVTGNTVGAGTFRLRAINDAISDSQNAFIITRSGFAIQTHQWFTANAERMRLDASGNLGIGTNVPAFKLEVISTGGYNLIVGRGSSGSYFETYSIAGVRHASFGSESNGDTYIGSRSNNPFIFLTNGSERARIFATGNFGIGTGATDSGQLLQVAGTARIYGTGAVPLLVERTTATSNVNIEYKNATRSFYAGLAGNNNFSISTAATLTTGEFQVASNGNVLINTSGADSGEKLQVTGTMKVTGNSLLLVGATNPAIIAQATATFPLFSLQNNAQSSQWNIELGRTVSGNLEFYNVGTRVSFTPTGGANFTSNISVGVTTSNWAAGIRAAEFLSKGNAIFSNEATQIVLSANAYFDGAWKYGTTGVASYYQQRLGAHSWYNAISGSANAAITFTQAMTLDASGNLAVGIATASSRVHVDAAAGAAHIRVSEAGTTRGFVGGANGIATSLNGYFMVRGEAGLVLSGNGNSSDLIIRPTTANVQIGAATDTGEKLQVNGTMKVTGASTFGSTLGVTGGITSNAFTRVLLNGSDTIGAGAYMAVYNTALTDGVLQQLNASNGLDWWTFVSSSWTKRMTLTSSGNLGLGVTPSAWQSVYRAIEIGNLSLFVAPSNTEFFGLGSNWFYNSAGNPVYKNSTGTANMFLTPVGGGFQWRTAASGTAGATITWSDTMTLNASGNLGLGVTPSAWWSLAKVIQVGNDASFMATAAGGDVLISTNAYYDGSTWRYIRSSVQATNYYQSAGQHVWRTAASGTAGNAFTFTQAMTLDASSNLLLGSTTSSGERLQVTGTAKITGATTVDRIVTSNGNTVLTSVGGLNYIGKSTNASFAGFNFQGVASSDMFFGRAANADDLIISTSNTASPQERIRFGQNGTIAIPGQLVAASLTVDTNTLFVDAINNMVGIGTTTPSYGLHVNGTLGVVSTTNAELYVSGGSNQASIINLSSGNTSYFRLTRDTLDNFRINTYDNTQAFVGCALFIPKATTRVLINSVTDDTVNTLQVSGTGKFTSNVLSAAFIPEAGTVPVNGMYLPTTNAVGFSTNSVQRIRIKAEGHVRFVPLTAAPTTNVEAGDVYYNSTDNKHYGYNGTSWNAFY